MTTYTSNEGSKAVEDDSRAYKFVMEFVAASDKATHSPYIDVWQEILGNFFVDATYGLGPSTTNPYRPGRVYTSRKKDVILKDPETHKVVMTYASKLVRALYGSRDREYIKAKPRGWEDAPQKAPTVSRLLRYDFALPGHFRTLVESKVDMLLFGTSIIETSWCKEEREMPVRSVVSEMGVETYEETRLMVPTYDDVKLRTIDPVDFYPDPSRYRIQDMPGAAKRFKMNAFQADYEVKSGNYSESAVKRAKENLGKHSSTSLRPGENPRAGLGQPQETATHSDFREMIGYEYWGNVPWVEDYSSSRRVITVLNNVVVRNDPWPIADPALPWHTMIINPVQGRFWGLSPAEVIRYDQDFADVIKILLAEAIIRQVHPPIAFDPDSNIDVGALKAWKADALIAARGGPSSVGVLAYNANVSNGFAMLSGLKNSMQEASGALGAIQGEPGPSRESASVGTQRIQFAMDRPELAAMIIENECLPPMALSMLRLNQQFLDSEGLQKRIGEQPESVWIGDIMGEFDVEFVGTRMAMSRPEKLQSYQTLAGIAGAIPPLQAQIPWTDIARELVGDVLQLPEVAARMQDPRMLALNMAMMQALGPGGGAGNNGVPTRGEPPGMLPAQSMGAPSEPA